MTTIDKRNAIPSRRHVTDVKRLVRSNVANARARWNNLGGSAVSLLQELTTDYLLRVPLGDLILLEGRWYVTHAGLLRLARRKRCLGIRVQPVRGFCDPNHGRWVFAATVFTSRDCKGFVGYGDADVSNVSPLVRGAEMRVAETRAVNRALRKAYGIGICSVEEVGYLCRAGTFLPRVEEATAAKCERELWGLQGARPALPNHPQASARSEPGEVLCRGLLRD